MFLARGVALHFGFSIRGVTSFLNVLELYKGFLFRFLVQELDATAKERAYMLEVSDRS